MIFLLAYGSSAISQSLTTAELTRFPYYKAEAIADSLSKKSWEPKNVEFITDSNYVRKTWMKPGTKGYGKSYFIHYEFTKDTSENYIIYQFANRTDFTNYKSDLKKAGYKLMSNKSRKKMMNTEKITLNGKEDIFYLEKTGSVSIVEDAFVYGLNSFLFYSYKSNSAIAKYILFYH